MWPFLLFLALIWWASSLVGGPQTIPYSEFKQHLAKGEVSNVVIGADEIAATLELPFANGAPAITPSEPASAPEGPGAATAGTPEPMPATAAEVPVGNAATGPGASPQTVSIRAERVEDANLVAELEAAGVAYSGARPDVFGQLLVTWLLPLGILLLFAGTFFRSMARRAGNEVMSFGKSKARLVAEEGTGVTFDDVAGCDEAKDELAQIVEFLKSPSRFTKLGGHIPKGVLLLGPPGTGKTLLARAMAGESGVPFFSLTGSDFVEMFVGVGAARVRDLFVQAKAKAPCIMFIDEIDAIGRQRGVSMGVVNDEREQTLNQLLAEMDGFETNSGVILLAATNRPEILDKALLRPGRFDRQVVLDAPDVRARQEILRVHTRGKPLARGTDLESIAQATPGMSGADLANAINEAALLAAERHHKTIKQGDLEDAIEKVVAGPERRSRRLEPDEKRRVAYHESGHAIIAANCQQGDPVQKITIVPRGRAALGYTLQIPEREHFLRTEQELLDRLCVLMGGRVAEELVFGDASTGASDDLRVATDMARQMVCVFGMSERLGLPHSARAQEGAYLGTDGSMMRDCSEETSREIDEEVRGLLESAHNRARALLETQRDKLERLAAALLEKETLDRVSFERIVNNDGEIATAKPALRADGESPDTPSGGTSRR